VSLKRAILLGCVLALLATACAGPSSSTPELPGHIDSPTTPWDGFRFRSDSPTEPLVTTEPSEQLRLVEWVGPFTIRLEMGLPIQVTQPSNLDPALGTVSGHEPDVRLWTAQPPSETASTTQPTTSAAEMASDRRDNGLEDPPATGEGPELTVSDPAPATVDGATATEDQEDGDGDNQTVVSERCQDWQPRPGDDLRPCMGGPQFLP
jgi:hypothetical protein